MTRTISLLCAALFLVGAVVYAQGWPPRNGNVLPASCSQGEGFFLTTGAATQFYECTSPNTWSHVTAGGPGGDPFPTGGIILILSGSCPAGFAEEAGLSGKFVLGTVAANGDIGTTGGSDAITPAGSVSQPTFTGTEFDNRPAFAKVIFCKKS